MDLSAAGHGSDDHSLTRVPLEARYGWVSVALQRFGQLSALAQFFIAASIGVGMGFWDAMLAIFIGSVLLEILTIFVGIAGQREGLSTSMLARWSGFGRHGSALVGIVMAVSLAGWFAIQNAVFAAGLQQIFPQLPFALLCMVGGLVVTFIVVRGFKAMNWVAWVSVPAFLLLCLYAVSGELAKQSLGSLMSSPAPGQPMSMASATTIVAGGFIVGAIFTPDMSRYNRSAADVVKQTIVGVTLGEFFVGVIGVLLAHALKIASGSDAGMVVGIIQTTSGTLGLVILILSIIKINDWNLYPSSLGVVNAVQVLTGRQVDRGLVAWLLGLAGSVISALGFADHMQGFLINLGVLCPPIAAIMIADYWVCRSWRVELDDSRARGELPRECPNWSPAGLLAWVLGAFTGFLAMSHPEVLGGWLVPSLSSVVVAFIVHVVLGRFQLARGKAMGSGAARTSGLGHEASV